MFTVEQRDAVRERVLELASADERVVAGAAVGGLALGGGDRWSDLDLTFGVADGVQVIDVIEDWTSTIAGELDAVVLFDLERRGIFYRVFLLPGCLQMDLSFMPAAQFGAGGPKFRLLFGETVEKPFPPPPSAHETFGWAIAYARDARAAIERGRPWQAEFSISALRDHVVVLACRARGLLTSYSRGADDLPADLRAELEGALVRSLDRGELLRALVAAVELLIRESGEAGELAARAEPSLRALIAA